MFEELCHALHRKLMLCFPSFSFCSSNFPHVVVNTKLCSTKISLIFAASSVCFQFLGCQLIWPSVLWKPMPPMDNIYSFNTKCCQHFSNLGLLPLNPLFWSDNVWTLKYILEAFNICFFTYKIDENLFVSLSQFCSEWVCVCIYMNEGW